MPRRTYEADGRRIEVADDLDDLVSDKREGWRVRPPRLEDGNAAMANA